MDKKLLQSLWDIARITAQYAYCPYSKFHVGAALLDDNSKIWTGVNMENRSFGLSLCAERCALAAAVSQGVHKFRALAIATPDSDYPVGPCGACRQVLSEFMGPETIVFFGGGSGEKVETTIGALYPFDSLHDLAK